VLVPSSVLEGVRELPEQERERVSQSHQSSTGIPTFPPPAPIDTKDRSRLRVLDVAEEAKQNAVIGVTHVRRTPADIADSEERLANRRNRRAVKRIHRGDDDDDFETLAIVRPKYGILLVLSFISCVFILVSMQQLGIPLWICCLMAASLMLFAIFCCAVTEFLIQYPWITEFILFRTGLFDDLRHKRGRRHQHHRGNTDVGILDRYSTNVDHFDPESMEFPLPLDEQFANLEDIAECVHDDDDDDGGAQHPRSDTAKEIEPMLVYVMDTADDLVAASAQTDAFMGRGPETPSPLAT